MNIFILDENIDKCAEAHVDKHIVKMPLEAAQMLCTNHWIVKYLGHIPRKLESHEWQIIKEAKTNEVRDFPYLPTMYNHPCTIWARVSLDNYEWLFCYESHSMMNTDTGMERNINQCMMSYSNYPTSFYQGVDSHHLLKLCQTNLKETTQLKPIEDSTTKTKQPLPSGSLEKNQTGG